MGQRSKHDGRTFEPLPTCGTRYPESKRNIHFQWPVSDTRCGRDRGHDGDHEMFGVFKGSFYADKNGKIKWARTRARTYVR